LAKTTSGTICRPHGFDEFFGNLKPSSHLAYDGTAACDGRKVNPRLIRGDR
jgi:hypothetical protein